MILTEPVLAWPCPNAVQSVRCQRDSGLRRDSTAAFSMRVRQDSTVQTRKVEFGPRSLPRYLVVIGEIAGMPFVFGEECNHALAV